MTNMVIGGFGGGSNVPVYGFGGPFTPLVPRILPTSGTIRGGDQFTIINSGLSMDGFIDTFPGATLNGVLWTSATSGTGAVSVNNKLILDVGIAAGTASIRSVATYGNFDVTAVFKHVVMVEDVFPSNEIVFLHLRARIDSANYFTIAHIWDPTRGASIKVSVTSNSITTQLDLSSIKASSRSLRLVRFGGRILAYAGSVLLIDFRGWQTDLVNIELASSSTISPFPLRTEVTLFQPQLIVVFGDEIAPFVSIVVGRVIGSTPAVILPGIVEVVVYSNTDFISLGTVFNYVAPLQLTVAQSDGVSIVVSNDDTLRDTSTTLTGFRL